MLTCMMLAALRLASPFSDHAVLQREKPVLVWGYGARRDEHLTATVGGATAVTRANADGSFRFRLAPQKAGGPFVLEVKDARGGAVRAEDVWFGEVWLCSGQSNMARHMRDAAPQLEGNHPLVRQFLVRRGSANMPLSECGGEWYLAEGAATKNFTAVGAFFADRISRELGGVAVGLVNASEGGTDIEQWSSAEALRRSPSGLNSLNGLERDEQNPKRFDRFPPYVQDEGVAAKTAHWHEKGFDDSAWRPVELPNDFWTAYKTNQFNGAVWFRRHVKLPKDWVGRKLDLVLGQMDKSDVTWANGRRVGGMGGGNDATFYDTPRIYSTTSDSEELVIAFRIWSYAAGGGVYGDAAEMFVCLSDDVTQRIPVGGTWLSAVERNIGERHCHDAPLVPTTLFNAMIAPMAPYSLRGFLWYQGCSNGSSGMAYRYLQNEMARDWRRRWGDDDLPFACVLLAGIGKRTQYSERSGCGLRFLQALSVRDLGPHAGYVSAVDVGDVGDIHPKDKKTVGERLAQWAMAECYGRAGVSTAPIYLATRREGVRLRVLFERVGKGLRALGPNGTVRGVYVAGKDGKFVPAEAKVDVKDLVVSAPSVTEPVAVRYGWSSFPETFDLTNDSGMPAAPFEGKFSD